jgi:hypothetical protein
MGDPRTPERGAERGAWKGDAVEEAPDGAAEEAAARAEGNEPVPVDAANAPETLDDDELVAPRRMSADDERENVEEKREAAAEDHARDRAQGTGTAPKNL